MSRNLILDLAAALEKIQSISLISLRNQVLLVLLVAIGCQRNEKRRLILILNNF